MPDHIEMRPPGYPDFAWFVPVTGERTLFCFVRTCGRDIPPGEMHYRNTSNGQRMCDTCARASGQGRTRSSSVGNRRERHAKIERAHEHAIQFLLDGLEVESIQELKMLVDIARVVQARILKRIGETT